MAPGDPPLYGVGDLREAVALAVERRSLRQAARDIGMSPSGLRKFLDGAEPHMATQRKLERWYVREGGELYGAEVGTSDADSALRILLQDLPPRRREPAREDLLRMLREHYRRSVGAVPHWLSRLSDRGDHDG